MLAKDVVCHRTVILVHFDGKLDLVTGPGLLSIPKMIQPIDFDGFNRVAIFIFWESLVVPRQYPAVANDCADGLPIDFRAAHVAANGAIFWQSGVFPCLLYLAIGDPLFDEFTADPFADLHFESEGLGAADVVLIGVDYAPGIRVVAL